MSNEPETPEEKGAKLLAGLDDTPPSRKFDVAPDVKAGDLVYLNAETGRYEGVIKDYTPSHGVFDGYDIIISTQSFTIRHSLIDGHISADEE